MTGLLIASILVSLAAMWVAIVAMRRADKYAWRAAACAAKARSYAQRSADSADSADAAESAPSP